MKFEPLPCQQEYGPSASEGSAPLQKLPSLLPIVLLQPGRDLRNFHGRMAPQGTTGYMVWKGEQEVSE